MPKGVIIIESWINLIKYPDSRGFPRGFFQKIADIFESERVEFNKITIKQKYLVKEKCNQMGVKNEVS